MNFNRLTTLLTCTVILGACGKEPAPRSVSEFVQDPILLESALLRCTQARAESRYDPECINAREAVKRVAAEKEKARRSELERQSEQKREALRRTQQAAAEARRRALEEQKRREEAEYLAQFGELPPPLNNNDEPLSGNEPGVVVMPAAPEETLPALREAPPNSAVGSNAPGIDLHPPQADAGSDQDAPPAFESRPAEAPAPEPEPAAEEPAPDLGSIRDELRRRNEEDGQN
tara:strand:+ start:2029 stop:2724 length:696 start_codon:yes stop_codon:yes gene_type:complete